MSKTFFPFTMRSWSMNTSCRVVDPWLQAKYCGQSRSFAYIKGFFRFIVLSSMLGYFWKKCKKNCIMPPDYDFWSLNFICENKILNLKCNTSVKFNREIPRHCSAQNRITDGKGRSYRRQQHLLQSWDEEVPRHHHLRVFSCPPVSSSAQLSKISKERIIN